MNKKIVYKTSLVIAVILSVVMLSMWYFNYLKQQELINTLELNQKSYIIEQLEREKNQTIKAELSHLNNLIASTIKIYESALYDFDKESAKQNAKQLMLQENIKGVEIYDIVAKAPFLTIYKTNNVKQLKFIKQDLFAHGDKIGYIKVYYDNSIFHKKIEQLKDHNLYLFELQSKMINDQLKQQVKIQFFSFIVGLLIVVIAIVVLLKKFVNNPLVEFQKGLQSFFDYLEDPTKKVKKIEIDTDDEFGEMTKSVNESIAISMKMHGEMAQLMRTMDKNVITSETDENGVITYVSEAFCKISGYAKDELIGNTHNILRDPDMPKEMFEELWRTIQNDQVWEGEIKNRKKDGEYYWVYTIISPKCMQTGASCGYTAIRYDITDKKAIEDLTENLEVKIYERTKELDSERKLINSIINSQEDIVVTSDGVKTKTINQAFKDFYELETIEEFEEKYGTCICDSFEKDVPDGYLKKYMDGVLWIDYISQRPDEKFKVLIKKDNKHHIFNVSVDSFIFENQKYVTIVLNDITQLEEQKQHLTKFFNNNGVGILIVDSNRTIIEVNEKFCNLWGYKEEEIIGQNAQTVHISQETYIEFGKIAFEQVRNNQKIEIDYQFKRKDGSIFWAKFSGEQADKDNTVLWVISDITEIKNAQKQIEIIHKHTRDSIQYASLIQGALIPQSNSMEPFFKDYFVHWEPKDTVGGDIWLFNKLRHEDECLLMFIDCTGHGVAGAFVTMIVKAIEREIVAKIVKHPEFDISPAVIMGYFNRTMKTLLKQESKDSLSNAGFDGGIIYYNRRTQILKFAGAETPLFYMAKDGELKTLKGNRYSVGYKKCDVDYSYKEVVLKVEEGMKFYCTTDGYLDQNGGEKGFPFGKKRFANIIQENCEKPMFQQQNIFVQEMNRYESMIENNDRNDDITVIGFEIAEQSDIQEASIEEIVKYEGVMTQNVIATAMDNIGSKITNTSLVGVVSTITIEYCQNMMHYSKGVRAEDGNTIVPAGQIEVKYINNEYYEIIAINIVSIEDKEKIEPVLIEIQGLDKAGIKKRYRELRKSGKNTHSKGGGIGLYEIAKVSNSIEYAFEVTNNDKYRFMMKSIVKSKKD